MNRSLKKPKKTLQDIQRYKYIYLLMLPGIVYLLIFRYYPMYFLQIAFKNYTIYTGLENAPWVGLAKFRDLFKTKYFLQAFSNTVIISLMKICIGFPVPIILALLLNEIHNGFIKRGFQTVIYLPHFLSWVIVGTMWVTILSPSTGIVNTIIKALGGKPIFFMANTSWFRWVLLFTNIWKESGWGTIVYLAAISGIDQEIYESALMDGAGRFKQIWYITLPSIRPTILIVFILGLAKVLNVFEQVFVMYNPIVAEVSETIDTYVYKIGLVRGDMSFATTVGLFKNIISLCLILITNYWSKRLQDTSVL